MDSDKYLEGQSMQRPPLFESDSFIYWKNRFETYVKSKDLDLWHVITDGDFQPIVQNPETKLNEVIPFEKQIDDLKKKLEKNNEAKMVIYNALPRKEYERIFMCNTAKEIWKTLLITHQGNSQVKDNKIDLLVQQYEQFVIFEDKSIVVNLLDLILLLLVLKATRNNLENELRELKDKLSTLEKNKGVNLDCAKCHTLKIENKKLKEESTRLNKFEKSTHCLNEMLSNQKPSGDKIGLGFNSFEASSSGTKEIKFVKAQKNTSSDGGPINMGGPHIDQAAPKIIMGPPPATPGSEKIVSFQKSIFAPRPKHIIVNKVKIHIASENEVK
ncbi:hypothetical protein Tco_0046447 [Tanacetum coccineum]